MTLFFFAIAFAALAAVLFVVRRRTFRGTSPSEVTDRRAAGVLFWVFTVIAALSLISASFVSVSTKNEGIETTFGATSGHLSNGLHLKWPWVVVHEMDAAIQTDSFTAGSCLPVRIANQQTGCVNVSIRWRIRPGSSDELYRDYRSFAHVRDSLVTRELTAAVNDNFAAFNPLNSIQLGTAANGVGNPLLSTFAGRITRQMQREIGSNIEVLNTIIPLVTFDPETQSRINQLQQQIASTKIAEAALKTNESQARANAALAKSVNTSPNVLVAECFQLLNAAIKAQQPIPAGFSCWPGGSTGVVIPAAAK